MATNHGTMSAPHVTSRPSSAASSTSSKSVSPHLASSSHIFSRANLHVHRTRRHGKQSKGVVGQASWISSVVNLVNTIVGAGVLAMPLAMSHMGVVLGTVIIAFAGLTAGFGLYLQTRCCRYLERGSASFFALSQLTYPRASVIFDFAIAIKCFGVGVSYLIIIGDLMPGVVRGFKSDITEPGFLLDRHFWVTLFMFFVTPFAFLRKLDSLKYTSIVALFSIGYLVILVVFHFANGDTMNERGPVKIIATEGIVPVLSSFPVIVFAYTCHQNMFSIMNEMADPSPFKATSVVTTSIGSAFTIYLLVAITGYLSYGDNVVGNIVGMYTPSILSTVGKAAIVVLVMFSYALQVHPCRASIDAVLKYRFNAHQAHPQRSSSIDGSNASHRVPLLRSTTPSHKKNDSMSEARFAIITTVIIILSYIVAMTVESLDKVLAFVGSTGSTTISFILPGLFYYQISDPAGPYHQRLTKENDEDEDEVVHNHSSGPESDQEDESSRTPTSSTPRSKSTFGHRSTLWKHQLLRRLSLALAIWGICVMITCLITNSVFLARAGH